MIKKNHKILRQSISIVIYGCVSLALSLCVCSACFHFHNLFVVLKIVKGTDKQQRQQQRLEGHNLCCQFFSTFPIHVVLIRGEVPMSKS